MRVPDDIASKGKADTDVIVRTKHPLLGELEAGRKLKDLPKTAEKPQVER